MADRGGIATGKERIGRNPGVSTRRADVLQTAELRRRLEEAEEMIRAIRAGEVDAFVMSTAGRDDVFALETAADPYRRLVENMQQGAVTLGPDGAILFCNQRFADMLQVPAPEAFGRRIQSFLTESDRPLWGALEREAIDRGAAHGEVVLEPPRGSPVPVHVALAPFGRGAVGMSVMVTDLSDQKRHEAVLAAETLSKSILEQAADAIVVCDAAGTIIRTSHVAEELCGRNAMLLPFDSVFPLVVSGGGSIDAPTQRVSLREVLEGKTVRGLEVLLRREDGGLAHLLMSAAPLKQDRRAVGCVVTLTDITNQKAAERLLRESDRKKNEFLAVLGHELRNALGPVRNANQILDRADAGEDDLRAARAMLDRQVTHMTRLIDDLLDVSRVAQGKILLRKELFDIGALVRTVTADHRPLLEAGDLRLELSVPAEPIWTAGDPVRISQVVGNLLQNAAKFTDPGGRVTVSAETAGDSVLVEVRDTGIGMSPEVAATAFDFFSQSESSRDRSRGGLGLGLSLARGLVELHGGHLRAHSEGPGLGSRFTVRLPLDCGADASPSEHRAGLRRAALRILIVEDNEDMAESLRILLRLEGHRVETARTGASGVELAQKLRPDVVLCDLGLPGGMDGYSVAARLRAHPATCRTHLVALSGYADEDARSRAAKAGFDQHLSKPVSLETIVELLAHVVPN